MLVGQSKVSIIEIEGQDRSTNRTNIEHCSMNNQKHRKRECSGLGRTSEPLLGHVVGKQVCSKHNLQLEVK